MVQWTSSAGPQTRYDYKALPHAVSDRGAQALFELRTYRDTLSLELQRRGYLEDCLTLYKIAQQIDGDGLFIDVGANIGACSLLLASGGMRTLAFEPMPGNLHYLTKSLLVNRNRHRY